MDPEEVVDEEYEDVEILSYNDDDDNNNNEEDEEEYEDVDILSYDDDDDDDDDNFITKQQNNVSSRLLFQRSDYDNDYDYDDDDDDDVSMNMYQQEEDSDSNNNDNNGRNENNETNDDDRNNNNKKRMRMEDDDTNDEKKKSRMKYNRERKVRIPYITDRYIRWNDMVVSSSMQNNNESYHIPYPEMDELIGWATNVSSSSNNDHNQDHNDHNDDNISSNPIEYISNSTTTNIPLRNSFLRYIHDTSIDIIKGCNNRKKQEFSSLNLGQITKTTKSTKNHNNNNNNNMNNRLSLFHSFDMSALIAIGMIIEEMITITLLPYAQQHINRCRTIIDNGGHKHNNDDNNNDTNSNYNMINELRYNTYYQYTLPPEEVMFNLFHDNYHNHHNIKVDHRKDDHSMIYGISRLVTSYPPTRYSTSNAVTNSTTNDDKNNNNKKKGNKEQIINNNTRKTNDVNDNDDTPMMINSLHDSVNQWCHTRKYPDCLLQSIISIDNDTPTFMMHDNYDAYDYDQELIQYLFLPILPINKDTKPKLYDIPKPNGFGI